MNPIRTWSRIAIVASAAAVLAGCVHGRVQPYADQVETRFMGGPAARAVQELVGDLDEEAAGDRERGPAPGRTARRVREVETLAGARQAHVGEAPLLLHLARIVEGPRMREDALLEPADEDDVELEALGRVQRDERDLVGVAGVGVLVRHEGCLLEQAIEGIGWLEIAVALDDLAQLEQVGPAILAILRSVHEHGPVAR